MVYLTGDTHGTQDIQKVVDFFEIESLMQKLSKDDYLVILGDVGVCWDGGEHDEFVVKTLSELPVTTLFIDGNHENFDVLNKYPIINWKGGKVHLIAKDVLHLMRGQVFEIENKKFFTFGGGFSIDKRFRIEGWSWWRDEMPNPQEYSEGLLNLKKHNYAVDYVLTHSVPTKVFEQIIEVNGLKAISGEEELQRYFDKVWENTNFISWWFGHFHFDIHVNEKFFGLYEEVVRLI